MRRITRIKQVFFTPFLFICFIHNIESSSIVHDAAFSPDGKVIGVGTDTGFQILDPTSKNLIYSFPVPIGVKFLKWAPDSQRVLLVSWQDQEIPTYSLLDIQKNHLLFSFQEEIRWFYTVVAYYGSDEYILRLDDKIFPLSTQLGHPNALAFSPDGRELAYISEAGPLCFRSTDSGTLLREVPLADYQATSLGYTPDGEKMWIGLRFDTPVAFSDFNRLLYLSSQSGKILEVKQLYYDVRKVGGGAEIFWIFEVSPDQKSALAVSALNFVSTTYLPTIYFYMVSLEQQETVASIAAASISKIPTHRVFFSSSGDAYSLEDNGGGGWNSIKYGKDGFYRYVADGKVPYRPVPAHPFAPDGNKFLMIEANRLYIVDNEMPWAQTYQIITFPVTSVENFQQHESLPSLKEKHHED
jgi:WD40 repeat protein